MSATRLPWSAKTNNSIQVVFKCNSFGYKIHLHSELESHRITPFQAIKKLSPVTRPSIDELHVKNTHFPTYHIIFCFDSFVVWAHCSNQFLKTAWNSEVANTLWKLLLPYSEGPSLKQGEMFLSSAVWLDCCQSEVRKQAILKINTELGSFTTMSADLANLYLHSERH